MQQFLGCGRGKGHKEKNHKKVERETRVYRPLDSFQGPHVLVSDGYLHRLVQALPIAAATITAPC